MEGHLQHRVATVLQRPAVSLGSNCRAVGGVAGAQGRRDDLQQAERTGQHRRDLQATLPQPRHHEPAGEVLHQRDGSQTGLGSMMKRTTTAAAATSQRCSDSSLVLLSVASLQ